MYGIVRNSYDMYSEGGMESSVNRFFYSAFTRLVQDQLKTSNHLIFYKFFNNNSGFFKAPFVMNEMTHLLQNTSVGRVKFL